MKHDPVIVRQALEDVRLGVLSLNRASKVYNIPYATLGDKLRGRRPIAASNRNFLTDDEEESLSAWLIRMAKLGFGKTREDVKDMAKRILDARQAKTRAKDNRPGKNWMNGFLARHEHVLSDRKPMSLGRERAVVTASGIQKWFEEMKENLDAVDPTLLNSPHRLYNADESGFQFEAHERKVLAFKGSKNVYNVSSNNKRQVTVLVAMSAAGHYLQPLVIFPYKRIPNKGLLDAFPEAALQVSDNGWINASIFHNWLRDVFIPSVKDVPKPVVLFVDGHASHTSLMETSSSNLFFYFQLPVIYYKSMLRICCFTFSYLLYISQCFQFVVLISITYCM